MAEPKPERRRTWVGEWVRSEAFWRDVASQALGGLIVAAVVAVAVAALGVIPWLDVGRAAFVVAVGVGFLAGLFVWAYFMGRPLQWIESRSKLGAWRWVILFAVLTVTWGVWFTGTLFGAYGLIQWAGTWGT